MGEIRTFKAEHIPEVADLHLRVMRGRPGRAGQALENYFREALLENPWAAPDLPSLVYIEKNQVAGFMGVVPRAMEFKGTLIRVAIGAQFMIDRERHRGSGALAILRRFFQGPQDLAYTDGAGEANHIVWTACGGLAAQSYSFNWLRVLRPLGTLKSFVDRAAGLTRWAGKAALIGAAPADFLLSKMARSPVSEPAPAYRAKEVDAEELFECIQAIGFREDLRPSYERASFRWILKQFRAAGRLRTLRVDDPGGEPCGWLVYTLESGGASLLQLGLRRRDYFDAVFATLLHDAWHQGAVFVKGQAIPPFLVNLTHQQCLFRQANTCVLIHTRDRELSDTILQGRAALSRLDGEHWMRFNAIRPD